MPDPITRIIIRRGTETERAGVILLQSEPGYATDSKRLYIGDGTTAGGTPVSMRFLGFTGFGSVFSNVDSSQAPVSGDLVYDTGSTQLFVLTGSDYTLTSNYRSMGNTINADNVTIQNNFGTFSVKQNSLDATYLTTAAVGTGLTRENSNATLRIPDPVAPLSFTGNTLQITDAGVANIKLANMPPNTVKARLTTAGTPQDVSVNDLFSLIPQSQAIPAGVILDFAGNVAPAGYLICDGAAISRTTYATLFAIIGVTYGAGNGSSTFNVPDFRGRTAVGAGQGIGLTNRSVGTQLGEEQHLLSSTELPSHSHNSSLDFFRQDGVSDIVISGRQGGEGWNRGRNYSVNATTDGGAVGNAPHNVMQPSLVINKIIKT